MSEVERGSLRSAAQKVLFPRNKPPQRSARSLFIYSLKGAFSIGASVALFLGGFFRARNRQQLNAFLGELGIRENRIHPNLPVVDLASLPGADVPVRIKEPISQDGNVSLLELLVISRLVAARQPELIFEIGTFDGRTTLNLAANTKGRVLTLDLPASEIESTRLPIDPSDANYIDKPVSGARFSAKAEAQRITQLFGDSASFDFSPWYGKVDLVFIDGAHSREYVLSDTEQARRLVNPKGGMILWHDYDASFDGVTLALHELAAAGLPVTHIDGTSLSMMITGPERGA